MALTIIGDLAANTIDVHPTLLSDCRGTIRLGGVGNMVSIQAAERAAIIDIHVTGDNSRISIGPGLVANLLAIFTRSFGVVEIGQGLRIIGDCRMDLPEPSSLWIGADCMFADGIRIMTSDAHPVLDVATGARVNPAADITIERHVWLGLRSMVLKGVTIGADTVIGAQAVVSKSIPANSVAVGNPARVVRDGVTWQIPLPD